MTEPVVVHTVQEYAAAIGPHHGHATYRADDIPGRLLGLGCTTHGTEFQISISNFKATGDLEAFTAAMEPYQKAAEAAKKP